MSKVGSKNYLKNNGFVVMMSSIMASDSPATTEYRDAFTYPAGGEPPTTSHILPAKQESNVIEPAPSASQPDKEDEHHRVKDKDELDMSSAAGCKTEHQTKSGEEAQREELQSETTMMNGGHKLDAQLLQPMDSKESSSDDESDNESCPANCLYYTLQCCECSIT